MTHPAKTLKPRTAAGAREKPVIFPPEMVRAILDGRKTMTRRLVKHPSGPVPSAFEYCEGVWLPSFATEHDRVNADVGHRYCPYGKVGDRLWVKETWNYGGFTLGDNQRFTAPFITKTEPNIPTWVEYAAAVPDGEHPPKWRPSIHMPRWASRITLEITAVKVERLNSITEEDALAEGVASLPVKVLGWGSPAEQGGYGELPVQPDPLTVFEMLWESIHGRGAWKLNPWVFAISFKRIAPPAGPARGAG